MRSKGFSLVEMAIVMVLFGILFVIGSKLTGPLVDTFKRNQTIKTVDAAIEAVVGFAEVNNRIPAVSEFPDVVRNSSDIWGNDLTYLPDSDLTAADSVCERSNTGITLQSCGDVVCTTPVDTTDNIAFIVLSGGSNQNVQTETSSSPVKVYTLGLTGIDDFTTDLNRPEPYDDILKWVVLPELRVRSGCMGSPLKILTMELPSGFMLSTYSSNIFADGGVPWDDTVASPGDSDSDPDYRWCVTEDTPAGLDYECNGTLAVSADCDWDGATETGTWQYCTSLEISGEPTEDGAFSLPVFVRDNADNVAQRTFGMSISLTIGLNICDTYRVWNKSGSSEYFDNHGGCYSISSGDEITDAATGGELGNDDVIERHSAGGCSSQEAAISYFQSIFADNNADCCVNFDQSDRTCP
jgi:prepilin-type N-terminal cleavage/methylation domain-containing protein